CGRFRAGSMAAASATRPSIAPTRSRSGIRTGSGRGRYSRFPPLARTASLPISAPFRTGPRRNEPAGPPPAPFERSLQDPGKAPRGAQEDSIGRFPLHVADPGESVALYVAGGSLGPEVAGDLGDGLSRGGQAGPDAGALFLQMVDGRAGRRRPARLAAVHSGGAGHAGHRL